MTKKIISCMLVLMAGFASVSAQQQSQQQAQQCAKKECQHQCQHQCQHDNGQKAEWERQADFMAEKLQLTGDSAQQFKAVFLQNQRELRAVKERCHARMVKVLSPEQMKQLHALQHVKEKARGAQQFHPHKQPKMVEAETK